MPIPECERRSSRPAERVRDALPVLIAGALAGALVLGLIDRWAWLSAPALAALVVVLGGVRLRVARSARRAAAWGKFERDFWRHVDSRRRTR